MKLAASLDSRQKGGAIAISDLFSTRRRAAERSGQADVYQYTEVTAPLRVQLQQIFSGAIGGSSGGGGHDWNDGPNNNEAWGLIQATVCREHGVHHLSGSAALHPAQDIMRYLAHGQEFDILMDVIELCLRYIDRISRNISEYNWEEKGIREGASESIDEVNHRFRMASFGYQYESGQLFRIDSQFVHAEVVRASLRLLNRPEFQGPQKEFLEAHAYYRAGDHKEAVTGAGRAFESTMKAVCEKKGWDVPSGARATDLFKVLKGNGLFPSYLDASFDQLISTLKSGLPKVRNEEGAHGGGARPREVPSYVAAYALHLAAANIILIAEMASS